MIALPRNYDAWRLSGPDEDDFGPGTQDGETCNRLPEADEDMPRGYRLRPCGGLMQTSHDGETICESCGAHA
jgi:hypothetical protein